METVIWEPSNDVEHIREDEQYYDKEYCEGQSIYHDLLNESHQPTEESGCLQIVKTSSVEEELTNQHACKYDIFNPAIHVET